MEPKPDRDAASEALNGKPTALEWTLAATLVDETFRTYLGRGVNPNDVEHVLQSIRNGLAPAAFVDNVKNSEEARLRSATTQAKANGPSLDPQSAKVAVQLMYGLHLGRRPDDADCEIWVGALMAGRGLESCVAEIAESPEAKAIQKAGDEARLLITKTQAEAKPPTLDAQSARVAVQLMYMAYLRRDPDDADCETWVAALMDGRRLESCAAEVAASPEAKSIRP